MMMTIREHADDIFNAVIPTLEDIGITGELKVIAADKSFSVTWLGKPNEDDLSIEIKVSKLKDRDLPPMYKKM